MTYELLNIFAVTLRWNRPNEYNSGISYRILVSNCTQNQNLSTSSENITVTNLLPGTLCQFSLYSLANGILGEPQNITTLTSMNEKHVLTPTLTPTKRHTHTMHIVQMHPLMETILLITAPESFLYLSLFQKTLLWWFQK